ncbi:MAG: tetratricopeptide repeat protein, partial [Bacteroidota bacterium]
WSLVQFVEWFCKRYNFDSGWTDIFGLGAILLLPSALLFSWLHADEENQFNRYKVCYLINIGLLMMSLVPVSQAMAGSSTTKTLQITDENGVQQEVEVSKQKYIRQIAFLPFQNDANEAWLSHAFPTLIATDINQCKRFNIFSSGYFVEELEKLEYEIKDELPQNIKSKLTNHLSDYTVSGRINRLKTGGFAYEIDLYGRKLEKSIFSISGVSDNIYTITDSLSVVMAKTIFEKDLRIKFDTYKNIPTKELYSANLEALRAYFQADYQWELLNYEAAFLEIEKAVKLDKRFAEAFRVKGQLQFGRGNVEQGREDLAKSLQLSNSVSDQQQRVIKAIYYDLLNVQDKLQDFLEMWIKIHPEDRTPYRPLIGIHLNNRSTEKAIAVARQAEEAGHQSTFLLRLASLYARADNTEKVAEYIQKYQNAFPDDDEIERKIGDVYYEQHQYAQALKHYETYNTLNPLDFTNSVKIATTLFNLSKPNEAIDLMEKLRSQASTYRDSLKVYDKLEDLYKGRGQIRRAIALLNERYEFSASRKSRLGQLSQKADGYLFGLYHSIGEHKISEQNIAALGEVSKEYEKYAWVNYYLNIEDGPKLKAFVEKERQLFEDNSSPEFFQLVMGLCHKFSGECDKAIPLFEKNIELGSDEDAEFMLYECYQTIGNYEKAITGYEKLLQKEPSYGALILRYAECLADDGQTDKAKSEIEKIMKLWENADEDYNEYQRAVALSERVNLLN